MIIVSYACILVSTWVFLSARTIQIELQERILQGYYKRRVNRLRGRVKRVREKLLGMLKLRRPKNRRERRSSGDLDQSTMEHYRNPMRDSQEFTIGDPRSMTDVVGIEPQDTRTSLQGSNALSRGHGVSHSQQRRPTRHGCCWRWWWACGSGANRPRSRTYRPVYPCAPVPLYPCTHCTPVPIVPCIPVRPVPL